MSFTVERVKHRKKPARPEQELQRQLVIALKSLLTPATFFFAVPNGGWRTPVEGAILNGQGVRAGVPDLVFVHQGRTLCLELKAPKGYLTPLQRAAHVALRDAGARVEVARSLAEALGHLRGFGIPLRDVPLKFLFRSAA